MSDDFRYSEREARRAGARGPSDDEFGGPPRRRRGLSNLFKPTEDEKNSAMLCHLLAIFLHFIGPIIIWMSKKDESKFVDWHGREALNFSLNMMIYNLIGVLIFTVIAFVTCGLGALLFPLLLIVPIYALVMHIIALNAAKRGELYQYPLIFRIIGPPEGAEAIGERFPAPAGEYSPAPAAHHDQETAPASGGGMIWVWVTAGLCLMLLLGCFGGIGIYFIVKAPSKRPVASNATAMPKISGLPAAQTRRPAAEPANVQNQQNAAPPAPPPIAPPKKADPIEQALDDMKSLDRFARARAADNLAAWREPDPIKQSDVARELARLFHEPDRIVHDAAARALPVWATKDQIPELIELMGDFSANRVIIIARFVEFKDERAIKPLADALTTNARKEAAEALKKFGPRAEDEVIRILQDRRFFAKQAACDVLKVIGTKKCIPPLESLAKDRSRIVARTAQEALAEVKARNP